MRIIGLIGGIASGKSLVAEQLQACGAVVLDGDRAGHKVLEQDDVRQALRQRWGESIFAADGSIDRKAVARIVFDPAPPGPDELVFLEKITHPKIRAQLEQEAAQHAASGAVAAVLDAPVMLKAGWDDFCDVIIFVEADEVTRLRRAQTRGWSPQEFYSRQDAQEPIAEKRSRADFVVKNSGTKDQTRRQVEHFWQEYVIKP